VKSQRIYAETEQSELAMLSLLYQIFSNLMKIFRERKSFILLFISPFICAKGPGPGHLRAYHQLKE
jgi:hypothetical protein